MSFFPFQGSCLPAMKVISMEVMADAPRRKGRKVETAEKVTTFSCTGGSCFPFP
jgi:hypothetical protein